MKKETEEANKAIAETLIDSAIRIVNFAGKIKAGAVADYDAIAGVGADIAILARALNKYQKATPYGRKLLGSDQQAAGYDAAKAAELTDLCKPAAGFGVEGVIFKGDYAEAVNTYVRQQPSVGFFTWLYDNYERLGTYEQ